MLFNIIAIIIGIPLAIIIFAIIFAEIGDTFSNLRYRHDLLKSAKKVIAEAKLWKDDVEFYLNIIENQGPLTFKYKNSYQIVCDYNYMHYLLERINIYLENYAQYVKYVNINTSYGIYTPHFDTGYSYNVGTFNQSTANYASILREDQEIGFLRALHEYRKNST